MSDWWESELLCRATVAENTVACVLRRPAGFQFAAGQYVELKLCSPAFTDALGPTRAMSIASAPSDDDLVMLMRIRDSAFKRSIMNLAPGARLSFDGPADDLTFDVCSGAPVVLIAGGVGIAPDELSRLSAAIGLEFVPTMTRMGDATVPWQGETERLSAAMIHRHIDQSRRPRYYVSGSTLFVSGLCYDLERAGVPARDIRIEMYPGY